MEDRIGGLMGAVRQGLVEQIEVAGAKIAADQMQPVRAVAFALLAPAVAWAQVDTSDWVCEYCPFEEGNRADYDQCELRRL